MQLLLNKLQGDRAIWVITFLLSLISILAVYSSVSTLVAKADGNSAYFLIKHSIMIGLGFATMFVVHKFKVSYFSKAAQVLIYVAAAMLLFTLLFGVDINSAKRWIRVPFTSLTFQTSDFAKIVLILYVARILHVKKEVLDNFKEGVLPILIPTAVICGLILPADLSTAVLLGSIIFMMMFIGGVPFKHLLKIIGIALVLVACIYLLGKSMPELFGRFETWVGRIDSFFDKESASNYQIDYAQYAIYEGGIFPDLPGSASSRNFLPHPYSDMIFAFIIQEYGSIIGGILLVFLYIIFLFRSIKTAVKSNSTFASLITIGLSLLIVVQAMINMAVSVNLIPTTGQPLPLVSMGGTSMIFTCLTIGIILAVSRELGGEDENSNEKNQAKKSTKNKTHASA